MYETGKSTQRNKISTLGVVLAGGKSTRMGTDKTFLTLNGRSFLEVAKSQLNALGTDKVLISSNYIEGALKDCVDNCGPLSAMHALAHYSKREDYDMAIICPVDMPLMRTDSLQQLVAHSLDSRCASYYENYPLPLCIWLESTLIEATEHLINNNKYALKGLLEKIGALAYPLPKNSEYQFSNVNTPEEFAQLENSPYNFG